MAHLKLITIDDFYTQEEGYNLTKVILPLMQFERNDFGEDLPNFNMVPNDADEIFSKVLNTKIVVEKEKSGVFRKPEMSSFIHFEEFESIHDWLFVVALDATTFNVFEHKSGVRNATEGYEFAYRNLFDWNLMANIILLPGQGVFFRPWLFHSFSSGLIQIFKMKEQ
jgi:hypothetical protein